LAKEEAETDNQTESSDKVENHLAKMMACQEMGREKARKLRTKSVVEALEPRPKKPNERAEIFEESN
jgi:predicted anti-sigma-YlaC factor YlaD